MPFKRGFLKKRLGAIPSEPDYRDFRLTSPTLEQTYELPDEYVELLNYTPSPHPDQGNIGSCVGWCGSIVMEITNTLLKEYAERENRPELLRYVAVDLSAGWLYYWSRKFANIAPNVQGSTNKGLMKALNHKGTALEVDVPTQVKGPWMGIRYDVADEERALEYAIDSYYKPQWGITREIKAAIYGLTHEAPYQMPDGSHGKVPLVSAYPVYDSFKEAYDNGIVPMPKEGDKLLGGHSSCILGWKVIDDEMYWINFNSWGDDVGDEGLFYIPRHYLFFTDWFLVHNGPPASPPPPNPVPSPCSTGNWSAKAMNVIPRLLGRRGRFHYMNSE